MPATLAKALSEAGDVPVEAAEALSAHAGFTVERILDIEKEVRHDVIAFTTCVAETMKGKGSGEASRWLHFGLTSSDTSEGIVTPSNVTFTTANWSAPQTITITVTAVNDAPVVATSIATNPASISTLARLIGLASAVHCEARVSGDR